RLRTYEGRLDGLLDFLWLQAIRRFIVFQSISVAEFEQFIAGHTSFFASNNFTLPTFLDNHDMNRFLWIARRDVRRLKLAALCHFTLASPPIIYYGTEVGLSQVRDTRQGKRGVAEESRLPMPWGERQDEDLYVFYRKIIAIRRSSEALKRGA